MRFRNIVHTEVFYRFVRLCAGRAGQLLNLSGLAADTGVSVNTAKSWIGLLEASYIIFLHRPYFINASKRLIKSPKLYFTDSGLLCYLLGIESPGQLHTHFNRGGIFENYVLLEVIKTYYNSGEQPRIWFWRDSHHDEIDLLIEKADTLIPVEIKSGQTFSLSFFNTINKMKKEKLFKMASPAVVYAGDKSFETSYGEVYAWQNFAEKLGGQS